jgi:hypothetical protein
MPANAKGSSPGTRLGPSAETTTSWDAAIWRTRSRSVASPTVAPVPPCRLSAVTSCPRPIASATIREPT